MKRRNPNFGYQRIADQIACVFGIELDKHTVRRVLASHNRQEPTPKGPSRLTFLGHSKDRKTPRLLSSDNDPLFDFHRWKANLRVLDINEIKTVPYASLSHPFIERLIGTVRREVLDHAPFWGERDLDRKLESFRRYFNRARCHRSLGGRAPDPPAFEPSRPVAGLDNLEWKLYCRGLYQLPVAA